MGPGSTLSTWISQIYTWKEIVKKKQSVKTVITILNSPPPSFLEVANPLFK